MRVLDERARRLRADTLRWRIGRAERRVLLLETQQLAIELVVFGVRDGRPVEDVILVRRLVETFTQRIGARGESRIQWNECGG